MALRSNDSAVRRHHRFGNGQAEAEAAEPPRDRALALLKRIEDSLHLIGFDADARVRGPDLDRLR